MIKPVPYEVVQFHKHLVTQLQALGETRSYTAGSPIAFLGAGNVSIYLVVRGAVSIQIFDYEQAQELTATHVAPHEVFGFAADDRSGEQQRLRIHAEAKTDCVVVELQRSQLLVLATQHPDLLIEVCNGLARFSMKAMEKVGRFALFSARGRISSALVDLCSLPDAATHPDGYQVKISKVGLAKLAGCTREMVGRVMKELHQDGLITSFGRKTIVHHDTPAL